MISKNKISEIRKLHSKKYREQQQLFIVEGIKSVEMLCSSGYRIKEIVVTDDSLSENKHFLDNQNVIVATKSEMERISTMQCAPEILAVACFQQDVQIPDNQPVIALDRISDPGNLGTIIRTADWFGIHHIVCSKDSVEFYNPKTIQATMGSFTNVTVHYVDLDIFLKKESMNRRVVGTFLEGQNLAGFDFLANDILVVGNEANGISKLVENIVTHRVTIPSRYGGQGTAESLNAAIATAIVLYKWRGL